MNRALSSHSRRLRCATISLGARGFQPSDRRSPDRLAVPATYAKDIAPLLADRCGMCHHPGGSAPFSLLTYADARRRATQIAAVTKPRHAALEGRSGERAVCRAASARRRRHRADRTLGGRRRGRGRPSRPRRRRAPGAKAGSSAHPISSSRCPQAYTLPAEGSDVFRIFTLPIPVETARFVRGLEFRPGQRARSCTTPTSASIRRRRLIVSTSRIRRRATTA